MKEGWLSTTLGSAFLTITGGTPSKTNAAYYGKFLPLVKPPELRDAEFDSAEDSLSQLGASFARIAPPNSILVSCIGVLGKVGLNTVPVAFNQQINAIVSDERQASPAFMFYQALSSSFKAQLEALASGTTVPIVNKSKFNSIRVVVPPLPEQQRIVAILDEAFAGIATAKANAEKKLESIGDVFTGLAQQLFPQDSHGPATHSLEELCEAIVDCEHKTAPTQAEGIPSIRTPNIGKGELLLDGVYRVSEETYKEWTRRAEPSSGDLIMAREAPAGNVAVIPEGTKVCLGQRTVLLKPKREVFEPSYLAHLLLQKNSQERLLAHSRGATVQHINVKDIRNFKVASLPQLEEQRSVLAQLQRLGAKEQLLRKNLQRKLAALEALKQSLLHQAFSGQL